MTDARLLEQVLNHIHNWFDHGTMTVSAVVDGEPVASATIPDGAWYRVQGSLFNDGLHRHPSTDLTDEKFDGTITLCAIPKALIVLVHEISDWLDTNDDARRKALSSPYQSESFDGYSYSIRDDFTSDSGSGGLTGWQAEFASRLNPWRKIG